MFPLKVNQRYLSRNFHAEKLHLRERNLAEYQFICLLAELLLF